MKRFVYILFSLYAIVHCSEKDSASFYYGMDRETVSRIINEKGCPYEYVTKEAYDFFVDSHSSTFFEDPARTNQKNQARELLKDKNGSAKSRLDALLTVFDLDI